jgi:uncharacterized secreted protein with C-terminal beta-propeller domain
MKKYIIYTLIVTIAVFLGSCNKDDIDTKRSIFDPSEVYEPNEFDKWLLDNDISPGYYKCKHSCQVAICQTRWAHKLQ